MIRRPPRSTQSRSSAASDVYKRQIRILELLLQVQLSLDWTTTVNVSKAGKHSEVSALARVLTTGECASEIDGEVGPTCWDLSLIHIPSPRDRTRSRMPSSA
eukprot:TRINITY_DN3070_c0_g1_i1.p1 TRINITY_DN3070_c0_g1~~TRINITY_DN3070_c0_g1_i1.p1  ORF type:complete len:102 (-),score=49.13 TRINITY_DN3070_c0_g1_i1:104-409(-)